MRPSYSLFELNEYVSRVIALNFPEPIWVNCEISQVKEVRGNVYIDLVDHREDSDEITAQISANIWYKSYLFLKNKLGAILPSLLKEGTKILIKVRVEFNPKYGMKLIIEDIDPAFTIGQLEINRQKILQRLEDEGLTQLNGRLPIPSVIQRVAVISSATAAGYIDFVNQLSNNIYGYKYGITLFSAALQGQNTEREVCQKLVEINERKDDFDIIMIMRGGGSKLDLGWFDNFNIGAGIAKSKIPVLTGIGHEIDSTVADVVAWKSLKTPTALANFLIDHNANFEGNINELLQRILRTSQRAVMQYRQSLSFTNQLISIVPGKLLIENRLKVENTLRNIFLNAEILLKSNKEALISSDKQIDLLNPRNVLKKGYTIVRQNGTVVKTATSFKKDEGVEIEFFDEKVNL